MSRVLLMRSFLKGALEVGMASLGSLVGILQRWLWLFHAYFHYCGPSLLKRHFVILPFARLVLLPLLAFSFALVNAICLHGILILSGS